MLIDNGLSLCGLSGVTIIESKVGRVVGHWMLSGGNVYFDTTERDVLVNLHVIGKAGKRISFFLCGHSFQCVGELHIRIEGIILGLHRFLAVGIIQGEGDFGFLGQQASQFYVGRDGVVQIVFVGTLCNGLLDASEACLDILGGNVDRTYVAQLDIEVTLGSPSSAVGEFLETELISPYLYALYGTSVVANTYHDGLHLGQCGITHDGDTVAGVSLVVFREELVDAGDIGTYLCITLFLQVGEEFQIDIHHILFGPYGTTGNSTVGIVGTFGCQLHGYLVFVEVALIVRTQTKEYTTFAVGSFCDILGQCIGMQEEL